jgi:hypothetical protein
MKLIYALERIPSVQAIPYPKSFELDSQNFPHNSYYLIGLDFKQKPDIRSATAEFENNVYGNWKQKTSGMFLQIKVLEKYYLFPFDYTHCSRSTLQATKLPV